MVHPLNHPANLLSGLKGQAIVLGFNKYINI
jgi:hypothetical protein